MKNEYGSSVRLLYVRGAYCYSQVFCNVPDSWVRCWSNDKPLPRRWFLLLKADERIRTPDMHVGNAMVCVVRSDAGACRES